MSSNETRLLLFGRVRLSGMWDVILAYQNQLSQNGWLMLTVSREGFPFLVK